MSSEIGGMAKGARLVLNPAVAIVREVSATQRAMVEQVRKEVMEAPKKEEPAPAKVLPAIEAAAAAKGARQDGLGGNGASPNGGQPHKPHVSVVA